MHVTVRLLADSPASIPAVADMRFLEWSESPEEDLAWWLATTAKEAGRDQLPVTFVAHDESGEVLGAVGLDEFDVEERHETTPWVTGLIVRRDRRREGVGRLLMKALEDWAAERGVDLIWVGTDLAADFYLDCGWSLQETFTRSNGEHMTILNKPQRTST